MRQVVFVRSVGVRKVMSGEVSCCRWWDGEESGWLASVVKNVEGVDFENFF